MAKRVPPSRRTHEALQQLFQEGTTGNAPSELLRLSVRQILEEALEAAARDLLGREYYQRREEGQAGARNGYREGRLATGEGEVRYAVPQVRGIDAHPLQAVRARVTGRSEGLERLAVEMYARGCSTRDVEAVFTDAAGRSLLSRTAVSEVTERLWTEYEEFATRDLSDLDLVYLFLDGVAERLRPGCKCEAILCAWGITSEGRKVLLHLTPGSKESTECVTELLADLKRRGLRAPVLVATDGAAGLIRAVEQAFPTSLRQRCLAHKMRNIVAKVPDDAVCEVREAATAVYQASSVSVARALRGSFVDRFAAEFPAAVRCFEEDFDACIAHLQCPVGHRRAIRTTNLLERLFVEERRRLRAALHLFGERPVMKLMYSAVVRASSRWRRLTVTDFERRQLQKLREQLTEQHRQETAPIVPVPVKNPTRVYSKKRT